MCFHRKFIKIHCTLYVKFIHSEKATKLDLFYVHNNAQIYGGDFAKFCGLLRIYEL